MDRCSVKVAMCLVVIYVVLSPKCGLSHFTESDLIISKRERKNWKQGSNRAQLPLMSASSKVLFRRNSVLNQTPTSVSLITIKIITAIFRFMAPANSGTFPWIIREMWEVQFYLVRKPLQIRLRRADLTGRDGGFEEEVLKQLCGRLMSGSLKLLCKNNWGHGKL